MDSFATFGAQSDSTIEIDASERPQLIVYVDGEEEFPWSTFSRDSISVRNIGFQHRGQEIFNRFGVKPTYLVDYPVASQDEGIKPLLEFVQAGVGSIGSQLHPWVNPPIDEELTVRNTFTGNLPAALTRAKIEQLTQTITKNFGRAPRVFKAGRYGMGIHVPQILKENGYLVDASVMPLADFSRDGGPDHTMMAARPYWLDKDRELLEIPVTASLVGLWAGAGHVGARLVFNSFSTLLRAPALLSRLGLIERIRLTPEGISLDEAKRLTMSLIRSGQRLFVLSYHSSSLLPGSTPYVADEADLQKFLQWLDGYCRFFFGSLGGRATTAEDVYGWAKAPESPAAALEPCLLSAS